jgi:hypothetical protein
MISEEKQIDYLKPRFRLLYEPRHALANSVARFCHLPRARPEGVAQPVGLLEVDKQKPGPPL